MKRRKTVWQNKGLLLLSVIIRVILSSRVYCSIEKRRVFQRAKLSRGAKTKDKKNYYLNEAHRAIYLETTMAGTVWKLGKRT
jgi:hypothetical protein